MPTTPELAEFLKILSGALTPITAIVAVYIAYQQYRANRLKLRSDLYQRRRDVYEAFIKLAEAIWHSPDDELPQVAEYVARISEAEFLFGAEVKKKAAEVLGNLERLRVLLWSTRDPNLRAEAREDATRQLREVRHYFYDLRKELPAMFAPYLSLRRAR